MKKKKNWTKKSKTLQSNYFHINNGGLTIELIENESLNDDKIPEYINYHLKFRHSHFSFENSFDLRIDNNNFIDYMLYIFKYLKNRLEERKDDYNGYNASRKEVLELEKMIKTGKYSKYITNITGNHGKFEQTAKRIIKLNNERKRDSIFYKGNWNIKDGLRIEKEYCYYIESEYSSRSFVSKIFYYNVETNKLEKVEELELNKERFKTDQEGSSKFSSTKEWALEDVGKIFTESEYKKISEKKLEIKKEQINEKKNTKTI